MQPTINALSWRYATKKFDLQKKLTTEQVNHLIACTQLAPSSYGLQPWKIIVVENPELRQRIKLAAWNQSQITDASHLFVLCTRNSLDERYVDSYLHRISSVREEDLASLTGFKTNIMSAITRRSPEELLTWNMHQTYLACGILLAAAASEQIDTCPMEGFNRSEVDTILNLNALGLTSTIACPVGYRSSEDALASKKKVRLPVDELSIFIR